MRREGRREKEREGIGEAAPAMLFENKQRDG